MQTAVLFFLRVCVALQMFYYNQFTSRLNQPPLCCDACLAPGFPFSRFSPSKPSAVRFKQLTSLSLKILASQRPSFYGSLELNSLLPLFWLHRPLHLYTYSSYIYIYIYIKCIPTKFISANNIFFVTLSSTCTRFETEDLFPGRQLQQIYLRYNMCLHVHYTLFHVDVVLQRYRRFCMWKSVFSTNHKVNIKFIINDAAD